MKLSKVIYLMVAFLVVLVGCEYDNYDSPQAELVGQVVDNNGNPIYVGSNEVELELWQDGFELREKIPVYVAQDGSFSAKLFDGEYKLTMLRGDGPWVFSDDTLSVTIRGRAEVSFEVEPYYVINDAEILHNGSNIDAGFSVEEINGGGIEYVGLYINATHFVDNQQNVAFVTDDDGTYGSLSVALPSDLTDREFVYARVGVKTNGVVDLIFSPVQKIEL